MVNLVLLCQHKTPDIKTSAQTQFQNNHPRKYFLLIFFLSHCREVTEPPFQLLSGRTKRGRTARKRAKRLPLCSLCPQERCLAIMKPRARAGALFGHVYKKMYSGSRPLRKQRLFSLSFLSILDQVTYFTVYFTE